MSSPSRECSCGGCDSGNPFQLLLDCPGPRRRVRFSDDVSILTMDEAEAEDYENARKCPWMQFSIDRGRFVRRVESVSAVITASFTTKIEIRRARAARILQAHFRGYLLRKHFSKKPMQYINTYNMKMQQAESEQALSIDSIDRLAPARWARQGNSEEKNPRQPRKRVDERQHARTQKYSSASFD